MACGEAFGSQAKAGRNGSSESGMRQIFWGDGWG
jgi:hypothetical protein